MVVAEAKKETKEKMKKEEEQAAKKIAEDSEKEVAKEKTAVKDAENANKATAATNFAKWYKDNGLRVNSGVSAFTATTNYVKFVDQVIKARKAAKSDPKETGKEMIKKTIPSMDGPNYQQTVEVAKSTWNDCLPLQFGLSKVMCDLFCVEDSVRQGTSAILSSLEGSQQVLMTNLQALLNYQTEYILWAIGNLGYRICFQKCLSQRFAYAFFLLCFLHFSPTSVFLRTVIPTDQSAAPDSIPSASGLLEELRQIDFADAKATVPSISRNVASGV